MASKRGVCKRDILRAVGHAKTYQDRLMGVFETYQDFPDFTDSVVALIDGAKVLEEGAR